MTFLFMSLFVPVLLSPCQALGLPWLSPLCPQTCPWSAAFHQTFFQLSPLYPLCATEYLAQFTGSWPLYFQPHEHLLQSPYLSLCSHVLLSYLQWSSGSPAWTASNPSLVSLFSAYLFFMIQLQIATPPPCHTLLQTHLRSLSELDSCPALASRFPVQSPLASLTSLAYRLPHPSLFDMSLQIWICC